MDLILWRHADAADGEPDSARPLTEKGLMQAHVMARWLAPRLPKDLRILVSPALRAQQTAGALQRDFETLGAIAADQPVQSLLAASGWPDRGQAVLIVGHQPVLGELAARLLTGHDSAWHLAKGAVWWLRGRRRGDRDETVLRLAIAPDEL